MVDVRLLGPVTVGSDGAVPLGGAKQRGLFAMLAGSVPPHRTDDQLVQGLWGEEPPASARNAVQVYVTGLRRALEPLGVRIARSGEGYTLGGAALHVDSVGFEMTVSQGRAALRGGDAGRAAALLQSALEQWVGRPFDGLGELPVFEQWRGALEGIRQAALADLAAAQLRTGQHDEAIATAQTLVTDHPYDERGWVALATAQYWAGRQADALDTCRRARGLLAKDLGVDPGPELAGLATRILRQEMVEPAPHVPPGEAADVPSLPPLPPVPDPLVGRESSLREVVALVGAGRRVVTLVGMGGIGKTTLALALCHRLHAEGEAVLFCELETETAAVSALDRICRDLGVEPGQDPAAAIAGGPADVVVLDNAEQVQWLAEALDGLVRHHATPLFVVTSRVAVGVRGEQVVQVPSLTVDPEDGRDSPASELFWATASRVRPGLDPGRDRVAVQQLCDLLGGIPLAIELVAGRMRTQTPSLLLDRVTQQRTSLLDTRSAGHLPARQATLRVVIQSAVAGLSEPGWRLVVVAGAVDGWIRQETLEQVAADRIEGDFVAALDDLTGHGLAAVDEDGRVRLPPPVREFVREQVRGDEGISAFVPVVVDLAEDLGPRLYGPEAGAVLAVLSADSDTISTVLNRACAPDAPAATVTAGARLLIALRRYWLLTARIPEARRSAARLCPAGALSDLDRARLGILDGNLAQWVDAPDARELLESGLREATRFGAPDDRLLVSGWCSLAAQAATYQEGDAAAHAVARASVTAAASGDPSLVALVQDLEGFVANQTGDLHKALEFNLRGLESARASGDEYDVVTLLFGTAEVLSELCRDEEAVALADEAFERTTRVELGPQATVGLILRGTVQVAAGQVVAARGSVLEGLRSARRSHPAPKTFSDGLRVMAAIEAVGGRDEAAARLLGAAMAIRDDLGLAPHGVEESRIGKLTSAARGRLGEDAWRVLTASGAAEPMGVVDRLLAGNP